MDEYVVFVRKAQECIEVANDCFARQRYNSCVNRAYYAMLQIAVAALFKAGVEPPGKRIGHEWVHGEFSRMFIWQRKRVPQFKGVLNWAQELRNTADYSATDVSHRKAKQVMDEAILFFETLKKEVSLCD